ncbi:MAG TPA: hypothetical protein VMT63_01020 [Bacteroidales bacterium]|nr:hypothetical protein [Bacteroidales bacterium]
MKSPKKEVIQLNQTSEKTQIDSLESGLPIKRITMSKFSCEFFKKESPSEQLRIKANDFKILYQIDSLLSDYHPETDYGYYYGTLTKIKNRNLVIFRSHGDWLMNLECLIYDNSGKFKGLFNLVGLGSEPEFSYECFGEFKNDSLYNQTTVYSTIIENSSNRFDSLNKIKYDTIQKWFLINKDGKLTSTTPDSLIYKKN